nr:LysR substrate-binding domain-containing protein [Sedimentitalea sp. CY04]
MITRLTHRQLEAFRAVMTKGKVTLAAEVLNTTQPTVSRLISDLESTVGFELFERRGRSVIATPEAQSLYEEVERSFVGLSEISRVIEDIRDYRRGSLLIAGMPALALQFLPRVVAEFVADEPGIRISLRARSSQAVLQHVSSQQFDLGFASIDAEHPAVEKRVMATGKMKAVLPADHPLCEKSVLQITDFDGQSFVALGEEISTRAETDVYFAAGGARPRVVAEAQLSASICEMVACGAGISIVEPVTAANFLAAGKVTVRDVEPAQPFSYEVLMPTLHKPSRVSMGFLNLVETRLKDLLDNP